MSASTPGFPAALPGVLVLGALALGCETPSAAPFVGFINAPISAVATQVAGQVATVDVKEGDRVTTGQVLATLDAREREAAVAVAEANVERARAALKQAEENLRVMARTVAGAGADVARAEAALDEAEQTYERTRRLVSEKAAPKSSLDAAEARLREARASLDSILAGKEAASGRVQAAAAAIDDARAALKSSQATLDATKVQLAEATIKAPFAGLVVERNLEPGEWAAPGTPVVTIENLDALWVRIDVEETAFRGLHVGMPAEIRVIAVPGRTFVGHVIQVGAEGEFAVNRDVKRGRPDIRTFRIRVGFDKPTEELRPGMTAEVRLRGEG